MLCVRSIDGESVVLSFHRSPMNGAVLKFNKIFLWNFFDELNSGNLFSQYGTEYWSEKNIRFYVSTQHIPIFSRKKNWFLEPTLNYMYQTRFCSYVPLIRHFIVNEFKSSDFFLLQQVLMWAGINDTITCEVFYNFLFRSAGRLFRKTMNLHFVHYFKTNFFV